MAVYHMAPPPGIAVLNVHIAAWVDDLRHDEAQLIEMEAEHLVTLGGSYAVNPPAEVKRDPVTHMVQRYRCSCVGFVMLCYASASIRLLDENAQNMPPVDLTTVDDVYQISRLAPDSRSRDRLMSRIGLRGSGPWPLVLPGYVFHSLLRPSAVVRSQPHIPTGAHESRFP